MQCIIMEKHSNLSLICFRCLLKGIENVLEPMVH